MTNRELVMQRLVDTFQDADNFAIIESLVEGTSGVSLRLLDFFLCHYSLRHNVQYTLPGEPLPFHVRDEYSQILSDYGTRQYLSVVAVTDDSFRIGIRCAGKVLFDCFSRKQRTVLKRGDKTVQTSAGQVGNTRPERCLATRPPAHFLSPHRSARWWRGR